MSNQDVIDLANNGVSADTIAREYAGKMMVSFTEAWVEVNRILEGLK
jgi:hypothetical protein